MRPPAPQPFGLEPGWLSRGLERAKSDAQHYPAETRRRVAADFPIDPICRHCSRRYSEHGDNPGRMVPRTECHGMREGFESEGVKR